MKHPRLGAVACTSTDMENGMGSETPMEQVILALRLKDKKTFARQVMGRGHSKQKEKCEQKLES